MSQDAIAKEALRQQMLLRALWRERGAAQSLRGWLRGDSAERGIAAYRGNAGAVAERALAGAFPTIAALLGEESFAALARDFWQRRPPVRGDLAHWGDALPAFIADQESLADEPYLADSAGLDWAWHVASRAADAPNDAPTLERLADTDPAALRFELPPGSALITSPWPIASIWLAHQRSDTQRFDAVRIALAEQRSEHAFVVRQGLAVHVHSLDDADARFTRALLSQHTLASALDTAPPSFAFDRWLAQALAGRWLIAIQPLAENAP